MPAHPYISGPGSVTQMIGHLRKNFPTSVTSETVKKFAIAPNNESYVINALQFLGVLDDDGKRTKEAHDVFVLGDTEFPSAFGKMVQKAYHDIFDLRGEDAWTLSRPDLVSYFRTTDKTSEVIGGRQAGLFQAFRTLAGYAQSNQASTKTAKTAKPKTQKAKPKAPTTTAKPSHVIEMHEKDTSANRREMAMTVRIEIALPSNGTKETYDAIFKSIRENLIDE